MKQNATVRTNGARVPVQNTPSAAWRGHPPKVRQVLGSHKLQAKLTVGQPNDKYEQEADRIADQVTQMPAKATLDIAGKTKTPSVQRLCTECEEEERLQTKSAVGKTPQVSAGTAASISSMRGGGRPLQERSRAYFEPRLGQDLGNVRIHDDNRSAQLARSVGARAFTIGSDIAFGSGEFAPDTFYGRHLLAHELTHVVQQDSASALSLNPSLQAAPRARQVSNHVLQRAPTLDILPQGAGTPKANQRLAAKSCVVDCDGTGIGTLHIMPLFHHMKTRNAIVNPTDPATGIGSAIHFIESATPQGTCTCNNYQIIQVITTTHSQGNRGNEYVDNQGVNTPFYCAAVKTLSARRNVNPTTCGTGEHEIPGGYPDASQRVLTTHSIYDRPTFMQSGTPGGNGFSWKAEARVACIRNGAPDKILGGVTYGFTRGIETDAQGQKTWKVTVDPIEPQCSTYASSTFVDTLKNDPTTSSYKFITTQQPTVPGVPLERGGFAPLR